MGMKSTGTGIGMCRPGGSCSKESIEKVREIAVREFVEVMGMSPEDGLRWTGTVSDLVEVTHVVWETGTVIDGSGRPMAFTKLVRHIFNILNARAPKRPTAVMNNVNMRKNVKTVPMMERFAMLLELGRECSPIMGSVRPEKNADAEKAESQCVTGGIAKSIV